MNALIYHGERALPRCLTGEGPPAVEPKASAKQLKRPAAAMEQEPVEGWGERALPR